MNHRELDCLIVGFSVGALAFLWIGYQLRQRVERWQARRSARHRISPQEHNFPMTVAGGAALKHKATMTGRTAGDIAARTEQDARQVMQKQIIPLKQDPNTGRTRDQHTDLQRIPIMSRKRLLKVTQLTELEAEKLTEEWQDMWPAAVSYDQVKAVAMTGHSSREDAIACLTGAGYKRSAAEAALDACTPLERTSGLEHWVATALRRAVKKP